MRNPIKTLSQWFVKRSNASLAAEKAGMIFLTQVGVLGDRFQAMDGLTDDNFLDWSSQFFRAALPWLTPRREVEMFNKILAWLDNYEIYQKIKEIDEGYGGRPPHNPGDEDEDLRDKDLQVSVDRVKAFLVNDAKVLLSLSFRAEDLVAADTLVISKPEASPSKEHPEAMEGWEMVSERMNLLQKDIHELKERESRERRKD